MSYQQCGSFRTTVDFDREYLWNGSTNRQETALWSTVLLTLVQTIMWILVYLQNDLNLWPGSDIILKYNRLLEVAEIHVRTKYHQPECKCNWHGPNWRSLPSSANWIHFHTQPQRRRGFKKETGQEVAIFWHIAANFRQRRWWLLGILICTPKFYQNGGFSQKIYIFGLTEFSDKNKMCRQLSCEVSDAFAVDIASKTPASDFAVKLADYVLEKLHWCGMQFPPTLMWLGNLW